MNTYNLHNTKNIFIPIIMRQFHKIWIPFLLIIIIHLGLIFFDRTIALISIWVITAVMLTNTGKQFIYLQKPINKYWNITGPMLGFAMVGFSFLFNWTMLGWQETNIFVDMAKTIGSGYHMLGENTVIPVRIIFLLFVWMIGPFLEELLFRGYIQSLIENIIGIWLAIIVQSVVFAMVHPLSSLSWPITIFFAGILYGWIRLRSKSIWPAFLAHTAYNIGILIFSFTFLSTYIY